MEAPIDLDDLEGNHISVICKNCAYKTDIYFQLEWNIWVADNNVPECPKCHKVLESEHPVVNTMTQELDLDDKTLVVPTAVYKVKAKHIEGTQLCSIELPCKYKDKELTIVVYE